MPSLQVILCHWWKHWLSLVSFESWGIWHQRAFPVFSLRSLSSRGLSLFPSLPALTPCSGSRLPFSAPSMPCNPTQPARMGSTLRFSVELPETTPHLHLPPPSSTTVTLSCEPWGCQSQRMHISLLRFWGHGLCLELMFSRRTRNFLEISLFLAWCLTLSECSKFFIANWI